MIVLNAEKKEGVGKGVARGLRRMNKIPAIVYGGKTQIMLALSSKEFVQEYNKGNIQSKLVELHLGDQKMTVIPRDVQTHPVTDLPEHVDFQEVYENTEIKVEIHIKVVNDDKCPGVKKGGVLNVAHRVVSFYCNPRSIPNHIVIDVIALEIGQNIHMNDIVMPAGVRPVDKTNFVLVSIAGRAEEKEGEGESALKDEAQLQG